MNSRLDNLKNSNPVYKDMDDEQILTTNYNLYYKDKISYDDFKAKMTTPITMEEQNKIALKNYQRKQNLTPQDIQNYLEKKETEELKSKGKIGFLEGFTKNNVSDFIPFADYVVDGVEAKQMRDIISRAYKGETLTQEETQKLRQFNKELKEDEVRGYTILGSLSSNVGNIFRVPMEFWITGGVAGGLGIGLEAGKKASILKKIAYGVVNAGTYTALQSPTAVYSAYQSRQLANMLKITDKGEEFFNKMDNAENFSLKELFKATGDVFVSNATELAGGNLLKGFVAGTGKLADKTTQTLFKKDISTLANPIMEKMLPFMKKASQSVFNDSLQNVVAKMGWNGFVEEVFEEWLEKPLRFTIGLEDDKYTLENFLKSMKMSSDEFLITIGAIAIQGGVSYSTAQLYNKLVNKGVDKDKATERLSTMTEKQKVNYLQQLEKYETEQDTKWYDNYINQLKNDFVKQGETQERVENNLKLLDNVFIRYAINQGTSRKDIVKNLILKSNNQNTRLQEQDLINKINNDLLPEFKQTFNKENLDKQDLLNILKSIKEKRAKINKDKSKSLIQFLINNGGVFDEKGDLKSQDLNKQYRGLIRDTRFINRKDRTTKENIQYDTSLDNQFKQAWQNGYFPEIQDYRDVDGVNTLINAINEEVGGNARYSSQDTDANIQTEQAEEFISQLEEAGLDINDLVKLQELDNINKKTDVLNQTKQEYTEDTININGVNKTVYNSNGERIARTKEDLENFYKWFGDSKAVDEQGRPLVVYHGTNAEFDTFDKKYYLSGAGSNWRGAGFYFSPSKEGRLDSSANWYGNKIIPVYLKIDKPFVAPKDSFEYISKLAEINPDLSPKRSNFKIGDFVDFKNSNQNLDEDELGRALLNKFNKAYILDRDFYPSDITDSLVNKGFDGIIDGVEFVAFEPNQIKSTSNRGTYSESDNIYYQQNKDALAQIQFKDTEAIITLFENANASSLTHEMGHYFLRLTQALAESGNVVAQKDLEAIRKWLKNDGTPFTREQEELFARSYEGYLRRGIAPSSRLQEVFNKLSEWLRDVYKSIKELNINLSRDVIDFFDNYLSYDIDTNNAELQNQINNLQSQMDEEINTLMQDGVDYNTAYDLVSDKYQERIDRIKQELQDKSRSSKDYDFNQVVLDLKEQENNKLRNFLTNTKKSVKDWTVHSLMTTENILKNLAPELYYKMSKYYASLSINKNDTFKKLEGFFNKLNNIEKENTDDYYILWSALYNRFNDKIQEILDKYKLYDDYIQVREILDDIRLKSLSVGVDVGYLENYFPRSLKADTRNEFLEQLRTDEEGKSITNDILYNLELIRREKGPIDPEQEAKYINNFLRGYVPQNLLTLTATNNLRKPRKIDIIQPQYLKYYEKPQVALHRYVSGALEDFYKRQLLGMENQDISKLRRRILNLRRSLKAVQETSASKIKRNVDYKLKFTKLAKEEQIIILLKKNQQDFTQEEKDLLIELNQEIKNIDKNIEYNKKANAFAVKNKRIKDIKNEIQENIDKIQNIKVENQEFNLENSVGYLLQNSDTLQNLKQDEIDLVKKAITSQLNPEQTRGFLTKLAIKSSSMALLDITNTINQLKDFANSFAEYGIKNVIKSINSNINIKIEDLGINDIIDNIQQDRWKFLDKMLKLNGLVLTDKAIANQQIKSQFLQTQELLKNNDVDTLREIELFFGNEAQDVINNLKELKNLDDSKIREWAYFKLSQLRPLNSGSKTLLYLTSGRLGRIAYILKNYAIKQLNIAYSKVYKEALNGNYKKAAIYGTELFLFTLLIAGSVDSAKNLILGMIFGFDEEPEKYITDAMIDNIILFNLIGRYNVSKVSREGIGTGFFEFMFMSPLVSISNDIYKDIDKLLQGDLEIQDIRSIKYLPYGKTTKKILEETYD